MLFVLSMGVTIGFDIRERRIPNWLNLSILIAGLFMRMHVGGWSALRDGLAGMLVGFGLLVVPFWIRWVGAGDVKHLMAVGAWLGPKWVFFGAAIGLIAAGLWGFIAAVLGGEKLRREVLANLKFAVVTMRVPAVAERPEQQLVPVAVPLAISAVVMLLWGGKYG